MITPFDTAGVTRGADGIKRYDGLPESLIHMLRAGSSSIRTPRRSPRPAAARGCPTASCGTRAARVAGGLHAAGVTRGDRVAHAARQRRRLGARVLRHPARRRHRRYPSTPGSPNPRWTTWCPTAAPGTSSSRVEPLPDDGRWRSTTRTRGPGGHLLHQRHDRLPQRRDDDARELPVEHRDLPPRGPAHGRAEHRGRWSRCRCFTSPAATASCSAA